MRVVSVNTCTYGSTGKIMVQIMNAVEEGFVAVPNGRHNKNSSLGNLIPIGGRLSEDSHLIFGRLFGIQGCCSVVATRRFLRKLTEIKPDIIHLHNLHNSFINLKLLFDYIKKNNIPTVWTLHDCWSFTGHCPYFTAEKCDRWIDGCHNCPTIHQYPQSLVDNSKWMWNKKKEWFTGVNNLTLVTPSQWLANLVEKSFLKEYPVKVINNGIDLDVFKETENDIKKKYNIEDKKLVLGVSFEWDYRKGLDIFESLSKTLPQSYAIMLVGVDKNIKLPSNIIRIERTENQTALAQIYSAADCFVIPTREDNYPTVIMEALACHTPVAAFDIGGCKEIIKAGGVVPVEDTTALQNLIIKLCETPPTDYSFTKDFDKNRRFGEYIKLYGEIK